MKTLAEAAVGAACAVVYLAMLCVILGISVIGRDLDGARKKNKWRREMSPSGRTVRNKVPTVPGRWLGALAWVQILGTGMFL